MNKPCVLFFVKLPVAGRVKTRLAEKVGNEFACGIYERFVLDILNTISTVDADVIVCFDPFENKKKYSDWLGEGYEYLAQNGKGLGERMKNAFRHVFSKGYPRAVLIGSDLPDLPVAHLQQSLKVLDENSAVIGPAFDGGYYLIGFDSGSFLPKAFDGISWNSNEVFDKTMLRFQTEEGYSVFVLKKWYDIDDADDLAELIKRSKQTGFRESRTYGYIARHPGDTLYPF